MVPGEKGEKEWGHMFITFSRGKVMSHLCRRRQYLYSNKSQNFNQKRVIFDAGNWSDRLFLKRLKQPYSMLWHWASSKLFSKCMKISQQHCLGSNSSGNLCAARIITIMNIAHYYKLKIWLLERISTQFTHFTGKELAIRWHWAREKPKQCSFNPAQCVSHYTHLSELSMPQNWALLYTTISRGQLSNLGLSFPCQLVCVAENILRNLFLFFSLSEFFTLP